MRFRRWLEILACGVALATIATVANAGEHRFSLLLDTDNSAATGCLIATTKGPAPGIEQVWTTVVTTTASGATVTRIERQICTGSVLGPSTPYATAGWSAGIGNGTQITAALETYVPLGLLPTVGTMKVYVASTNATGGQDSTTPFLIPIGAPPPPPSAAAQPIPLSPWLIPPLALLILSLTAWRGRWRPERVSLFVFASLLAASGLVWAATVVLDGNVNDWAGINSVAGNAKGSAPIDANIVAVFYQSDSSSLFFRIDADVRADSVGGNQPPVVSAGANLTITLPAVAGLAGTATDDGLPNPPAALTTTWSQVSGPGAVLFANPNALATSATFTAAGQYQLKLTASDGALSTSATLQVNVNDGPPIAIGVADRTIPVGVLFRLQLAASDPNVIDTLTFTLDTAPAGATLSPSPILNWTPGNQQLGINNFVVRVTDAGGRSATTSFRITVTPTNRAPQLAAQADESDPLGSTFTRTLSATDPDPGDTLLYSLTSGPAGMTLTGNVLTWNTAGAAAGSFPVLVKVTDSGGLFDLKRFVVTLRPATPPIARPDNYETRLGQTLSIAAAGVLANDFNPAAGALSAAKLSDPDKGTLNAFNADGSFNYTAPPTLAGPVFAPVVKYSLDAFPFGWAHQPIVIDVDGDGVPEIITSSLNPGGYGLRAYHVSGGALTVLWDLSDVSALTQTDDCTNYYSGGEPVRLAAGDIDDSGQIAIVFAVACKRDIPNVPSFTAARYMAVNARDGTFKWLSPSLGGTRPEPLWGGTSEDGVALNTVPSIARMHTGESPSIVFAAEYSNDPWGADTRCAHIVPGFTGSYCRAAFVLDGRNGTVRQKMIALATDSIFPVTSGTNATQPAAVVADLEGTGNMNIIFGATVWNADGSIKWNITDSHITNPNTHIYTSWNGLGNFDDTPDIEIVRLDRRPTDAGPARLAVFKADGRMLWSTSLSGDQYNGIPTIADIDGSGRPSVVLIDSRSVCAIDYRGQYKWCYDAGLFDVNTPNLRFATRAAVYDLDGDGVPEVIVPLYGERLLFLDGATGKLKFNYDMSAGRPPSGSRDPAVVGSPIVADFENNGHASILSVWSGLARMDIVASQNNNWRPARKIFNQTSYFVGNVNDNGSIPQTFVNNFANPATNVFGTQGQILPPVDPRLRAQTTFTYTASNGTLTSLPATVTIDILPQNRPPRFTSIPPTRWSGVRFSSFDYLAHATDPDVGDTIVYSIQLANGAGASSCTIGSATGAFHCGVMDVGDYGFVIVATDSQGAKAYQTVNLSPAAGSANVPNVIGQSQSAASTAIIVAGFVVGEITQIFNSAPAGQVLSQVPSAGTSTFLGELVTLSVSKGPTPVPVPFVVGDNQAIALAALQSAGFTVSVTNVFSNSVPADEVMSQSPAGGTLLAPIVANPVALTVSAGSGLALRVSSNSILAGTSLPLSTVTLDLLGNETPIFNVTYTIAVVNSSEGTLPSVTASSVTTGASTRGNFRITVTEQGGAGRTARTELFVLPPDDATIAPYQSLYVELNEAVVAYRDKAPALARAIRANDLSTFLALVQLVKAKLPARLIGELSTTTPFALQAGFLPTVAELATLGYAITPADTFYVSAARQLALVLSDIDDALASGNAINVATLTAKFAEAQRLTETMSSANPTIAGLLAAHDSIAVITASSLPRILDGLMNVYLNASSQGTSSNRLTAQFSLIEIGATLVGVSALATVFVYMHAVDAGNHLRSTLGTINGSIKEFANTSDIVDLRTGSFSSIGLYGRPDSAIEATIGDRHTQNLKVFEVVFLSSSDRAAVSVAAAAFEGLRTDPNLRVAALANAREFFTRLVSSLQLAGVPTDKNDPGTMALSPTPSCTLSESPGCVAFIYTNGFTPNGPCAFERLQCILPNPVSVFIWNRLTGHAAVGIYSFFNP